MAGNYLLSQATSNCGGMPEVKDGFFTTYYSIRRANGEVWYAS